MARKVAKRPRVNRNKPVAEVPQDKIAVESVNNPELEAELDSASQTVLRLKAEIGTRFLELGQALARVEDKRLYSARYRNFDRWLRDEVDISRASAYKFIRIARSVKPSAAARKVGPERLELALRYVDATRKKPEDITQLEIPVERPDGRVEKRPLADVSRREMESVLRRLSSERRARALESFPEAKAARGMVDRAQAALARADVHGVVIALQHAGKNATLMLRLDRIAVTTAWRTLEIVAKAVRAPG